jgi:hypothetical protein
MLNIRLSLLRTLVFSSARTSSLIITSPVAPQSRNYDVGGLKMSALTGSEHSQIKMEAQSASLWSRRLVFTESQIDKVVEALRTYRHQSHDEVSKVFISICCVPPSFRPGIVVIPVYHGSETNAMTRFNQLVDANPVSNVPTYFQSVSCNSPVLMSRKSHRNTLRQHQEGNLFRLRL